MTARHLIASCAGALLLGGAATGLSAPTRGDIVRECRVAFSGWVSGSGTITRVTPTRIRIAWTAGGYSSGEVRGVFYTTHSACHARVMGHAVPSAATPVMLDVPRARARKVIAAAGGRLRAGRDVSFVVSGARRPSARGVFHARWRTVAVF